MKKLLTTIALCLACTAMVFGQQHYDYLDQLGTSKDYYDAIYAYKCCKNIHNNIKLPTETCWNNYCIGRDCFKAGKVFFSVGVATSFIGAMCFLNTDRRSFQKSHTAGYALLGIGGTFISVSIPLLCFGDHIKRECNMFVSKY